jgi:hypothetical protein
LLIGILAFTFEYDLLIKFLNDKFLSHLSFDTQKLSSSYLMILTGAVALLLMMCGLYFLYKMKEHPLVARIWQFGQGIIHGLLSIRNLKNPILFIFYSVLIWGMYTSMIVICYNSLPETAHMGFVSGLAIVFFGGIAFIISQGGIGAYPPVVGLVLALYGVSYEVGFAFGWLVWAVQTSEVILCGVISFILVSRNFTVTTKTQNI